MQPLYWVFTKIFSKQQNLFAFYVEVPNISNMLFPWLKVDENQNIVFNRSWGDQNYKEDEKGNLNYQQLYLFLHLK